MVEELSFALANAMSALESSESRTGMLVDAVFDTFDRGAAGVLAAWLVLSNKQRYLEPVREAVAHLTRGVNERLAQELPGRPLSISSALLFLTLCAFGDALIGTNLCRMLRIDRAAMRRLAVQFIPDFV